MACEPGVEVVEGVPFCACWRKERKEKEGETELDGYVRKSEGKCSGFPLPAMPHKGACLPSHF